MIPEDPYLEALTSEGNLANSILPPDDSQRNPLQCYSPLYSVNRVTTPFPSGLQTHAIVSDYSDINFDCTPFIASNPGPSKSILATSAHNSRLVQNTDCMSASLPVTDRFEEMLAGLRLASRRPQLTTAQSSQASIEILNPKEEYDKIQRKYGPKGKISEQRISNGQVRVEKWFKLLPVEST